MGVEDASGLLEDPSSHLRIALVDGSVVGSLLAYELRRRSGDPVELFVYELGVRSSWRSRGEVGIRRGFVMTGVGDAAAIAF